MDERTSEQQLSGTDALLDNEGGTLAVLARAEINQQIATAKSYPRSITDFLREAEQLVTINGEMARACVYALPRGGKVIEGPSARFAEVMAYSFKNMRFGARPVMEDEEFITSQGVAYDLERNNGVTIEVRRRITDKNGARFNADMIGVTANAGNSIALRNAVLKIVPKALWNQVYQKARRVIIGDFETFNNRLAKVFEEFQRYGVSKEMICVKLGKKGVADIQIDDMVVLAGMLTALQDGDSSPEEMFKSEPTGSGAGIKQPEERKPTADEQTKIDERKRELAAQTAAAEAAAIKKREQEEADRKAAEAKGSKKDNKKGKKEAGGAGADQQQSTLIPPQQAGTPPDSPPAADDKVTQNMAKQISLRCEAYDVDTGKMLGHFGVNTINEIPAAKVNDVLEWIEKNGQS